MPAHYDWTQLGAFGGFCAGAGMLLTFAVTHTLSLINRNNTQIRQDTLDHVQIDKIPSIETRLDQHLRECGEANVLVASTLAKLEKGMDELVREMKELRGLRLTAGRRPSGG